MDAPSLTLANRNRLRDVVKRTHMRFYPRDQITDLEADRVIDALAPEVAEGVIKAYVDGHLQGVTDLEEAIAYGKAITQ